MRTGGPTLLTRRLPPALAVTLLTTALSITLIPRSASAQISSPLSIRAKLGVLTPAGKDVRDRVGSPLFLGELEVGLPSIPGLNAAGGLSASISYMERRDKGNMLRMVPITVMQRFSPPNPASRVTGNIFFGVGAGVYLLRGSQGGNTDDATRLGAFGTVGYELPGRTYFVEGKYHLVSGSVSGMSPDGLALMIGRRF